MAVQLYLNMHMLGGRRRTVSVSLLPVVYPELACLRTER